MSLSGRVRLGATYLIASRLFSAGVTFVVTALILARVLSRSEYGVFNFYLTMFMLAMVLVDFGANRAAIRIVSAKEAPREAVLRAAITFKAMVGVAAFLIIAGIMLVEESDLWTRVFLLLAASHMFSHGFGGASIGFEVDLQFRVPALSVIIGYSVFLASGLLLAILGSDSAPPYLLAWGAGIACQNTYLFFRALKHHGVARRIDGPVFRKLVAEALPLGLSAVAVSIYFYADAIMLKPLRGAEDVANYTVAYRLMTFGLMVPVLFSQAIFPVLTRCHEKSPDLLRTALKRSTFYLSLAGCVGGAVLFGLAPDLLELVYGEQYRGSALSLRILSVAMFTVYLTYPQTMTLIASGRAGTFTRITVASAVINLGLNFLVLKRYGPEGAAATTLVTEGFVLLAACIALWRALRMTGVSAELIGPLLLGAALVCGLYFLGQGRPVYYTLPVAVIAATVGALLLKAWPFRLGVEDEQIE